MLFHSTIGICLHFYTFWFVFFSTLSYQKKLAHPLTRIFRSNKLLGDVPNDWKTANVTPIYKRGSKQDLNNYRPISLTSQVCRAFDRVIKEEMLNYFDINNIIFLHGFLKNRSCLTNLLTYMENITKSVDEGHSVNSVYLDFRKAFDKVPHQRLLKKLEALGACLAI